MNPCGPYEGRNFDELAERLFTKKKDSGMKETEATNGESKCQPLGTLVRRCALPSLPFARMRCSCPLKRDVAIRAQPS